ncbi:Flp family type IVb pilin [Moritella sp. 24]|uniref:Flp family type IVb pilin n=1 Tax=Moritella sp. 24 TaxID=2746230 RepID=UPI001BAC90B2|nr:Flp family type IVb pilin [Moritella sp. 24]QUM77178.1 Flp family type IVb pilin [Moritella sp. 24]
MFTKMYVNTTSFLATYKNDERGVTAIEYGLIGVAMATLLGVTFGTGGSLLTALTTAFANITTAIGKIG